VILAGPKNVV
jgi:hypothetical protein